MYFSENFRIEDKEVKPPENFRLKVIGETTLRMASAELPRQGCHFMNAFVLIARFTKRTGSLGGTSKIRIIGNRVVFIIYVYIYMYTYEHIRNLAYVDTLASSIRKIRNCGKTGYTSRCVKNMQQEKQTKHAASLCKPRALLFGQRG